MGVAVAVVRMAAPFNLEAGTRLTSALQTEGEMSTEVPSLTFGAARTNSGWLLAAKEGMTQLSGMKRARPENQLENKAEHAMGFHPSLVPFPALAPSRYHLRKFAL